MKHLILSFSIIILSQPLFAQTDFCVPGATWVYYRQGNQAVNAEIERYATYIGDTALVDAPEAKILKIDQWSQFSTFPMNHTEKVEYVNQRNDSVFRMIDNEWRLMFDYNATSGDTVLVFLEGWWGSSCDGVDTMLVDSVYLGTVNSIQVRKYDYRILIQEYWDDLGWGQLPEEYADGIPGTYYERFGFWRDSPVHQPANCVVLNIEYLPVPLICYTDDEIIGNGVQPCSLVLSTPAEMVKSNVSMSFTSDRLFLQNAPNSTLRIYDTLGKELFQGRITSDNQSFDVSHLPNGVLMIVVEGESGRLTRKVVKTAANR